MRSTADPIARVLASWASTVDVEHLTERAREQLIVSLRDGLGCGIFGSTLPWTNDDAV